MEGPQLRVWGNAETKDRARARQWGRMTLEAVELVPYKMSMIPGLLIDGGWGRGCVIFEEDGVTDGRVGGWREHLMKQRWLSSAEVGGRRQKIGDTALSNKTTGAQVLDKAQDPPNSIYLLLCPPPLYTVETECKLLGQDHNSFAPSDWIFCYTFVFRRSLVRPIDCTLCRRPFHPIVRSSIVSLDCKLCGFLCTESVYSATYVIWYVLFIDCKLFGFITFCISLLDCKLLWLL